MSILFKILGVLGITSAGTGLGAGMSASGSDWWEIAFAVLGLAMSWLVGSNLGPFYYRAKKVISAVDDMLDDDSITPAEIKAVIAAFKK